MRDVFQQQANIDTYEVQLKHEQDERTRAQIKLAEIMVGLRQLYTNHIRHANIRMYTANLSRALCLVYTFDFSILYIQH